MDHLTQERSLRMRGAAIFLIYLHNYFHLISHVKENEFAFSPNVAKHFLLSAFPLSLDTIEYVLSYLGWYGVPVFMFLSGYGLTLKHERPGKAMKKDGQESKLRVSSYLWRNFLKLFVLMVPCYLFYALATGTSIWSKYGIGQLTMTANFISPLMIIPGVYWYFGLTLQFYILYLLFYRFRSERLLAGVAVAMIVAGVALEFFAERKLHMQIRHNSPLWLPVFLAGVWYARRRVVTGLDLVRKHTWVALLCLTAAWLWSTVSPALWVVSPLLALAVIGIFCIRCCEARHATRKWARKCQELLAGCLSYLGGISAGLFVCHPLVRELALHAVGAGYDKWLVAMCYAVVCIPVAAIYTFCYKKAMRWLLSRG